VGLLGQPEFSPHRQLAAADSVVERKTPRTAAVAESADRDGIPASLMALAHGDSLDGVWIGAEHPHRRFNSARSVQATYEAGDGSRGQVACRAMRWNGPYAKPTRARRLAALSRPPVR